ncbi:MAG: flagellar assembly protein FliH [Rhodoferax sp.]|nr:flagellar assembly protein FliH [Rhodoferax sp.]
MRHLSRFIPGEEIDAVARWDFGDVDADLLQIEADDRARAEAEAQQRQAERDAQRDEQVRQQAYAEGFAQGQATATLRAQQQHEEYVENQGRAAARRYGQLLEAARDQLAASEQVMAQGVLELACVLARQVLRHELSVNPNALQPVIREGLQMLADDTKAAVVRLHPVDLDMLQDVVQSEFAALQLTLTADASIEPGGCVITAAGAVVDASLETRWRRAIAKLGLEVQWDD